MIPSIEKAVFIAGKVTARGLWPTAHLVMGGRRQQIVQQRHGLPGEALPRGAVRHREVQAPHVEAGGRQAWQLRRDCLKQHPRRFRWNWVVGCHRLHSGRPMGANQARHPRTGPHNR